MFRLPALTFFLLVQVGLMSLGLLTSPIMMIGIPIIVLLAIWLIYNPGISLLLLALTGIIKGFLINIFPIFEVVDYTLLFTILIWVGLFRLFFIDKWFVPNLQGCCLWRYPGIGGSSDYI